MESVIQPLNNRGQNFPVQYHEHEYGLLKTALKCFVWFYCRYIDDNPWSCDMSTLHVLQMELTALVDKNPHLDDFDGGRIKCADPPDMKGKKPLHMINCKSITLLFCDMEKFPHYLRPNQQFLLKCWLLQSSEGNQKWWVKIARVLTTKYLFSLATVQVYHVYKERQADSQTGPSGGLIAVLLLLVMFLLAVICGVAQLYRDNLQRWIMWVTRKNHSFVCLLTRSYINIQTVSRSVSHHSGQ